MTVEVNGDWHESLHIFANPFEENVPEPDDPNVVFFGPGVHEVTSLTVGDNTTVYIAGGAYLRCVMDPDEKPVEMSGRMRIPPTFHPAGEEHHIPRQRHHRSGGHSQGRRDDTRSWSRIRRM